MEARRLHYESSSDLRNHWHHSQFGKLVITILIQFPVFEICIFAVQLMRRTPKMNWVKALLLLSCILLGCADLVTTNVILDHGLGELNPFMRLAQTWLGVWWLIPKLGCTFAATWLLSRSKNLYNIALVVALCSTPVLNNLIIIAGMK